MSNRLIRDGFVDSEAVNALTDWAHRVYSNLLVRHDNAGRTDGRLESLRSHLFPLGTTRRAEDFKKAVDEMEASGLVIAYEHSGKPYLQVTKVQKYGSAKFSKFPWKDGSHWISYVKLDTRDGEREFVTTSVGVSTPSGGGREGVGVDSNINTGTGTGTGTGTKTDTDTGGFARFWEEWPQHDRKDSKKQCLAHWRANGLEAKAELILDCLRAWKTSEHWAKDDGRWIPGPLPWLNKKKWEAKFPQPANGRAAPTGNVTVRT